MTRCADLPTAYGEIHSGIVELLEAARRAAVRSVNALMTASYWEIGRRIVEFEQGGTERAGYGEALIQRLADDLTLRFGRGFSKRNLEQMRQFYLSWPIAQTLSAQFPAQAICQKVSGKPGPLPILQATPKVALGELWGERIISIAAIDVGASFRQSALKSKKSMDTTS